MDQSGDDIALQTAIRNALLTAAKPISYGALARLLDVPSPGAIARITVALHGLMEQDMAAGKPFVAALCKGKMSNDMPALGFFSAAAALGRYNGPATGGEAEAFVAQQRLLLRSAFVN